MPSAFVQWMQQHQRPISYVDDTDRLGQARQRLGIKVTAPPVEPAPTQPTTPPPLDSEMAMNGRDLGRYREVPYADIFVEAGNKYGVDPALLMGMARQESGFNPNAQNPNSLASGIMQFMTPTWNEQNPGGNIWDPHQNIMTGAKYMRWLTDYFDGDTQKATLAYNGGVGNISRGFIPDESKLYLQKVNEYSQYYR